MNNIIGTEMVKDLLKTGRCLLILKENIYKITQFNNYEM
jgi:hypothetical protein